MQRTPKLPYPSHDVSFITQLETLIVVEVRKCRDKCICNWVTDFLGDLGPGFHPLIECDICDIATNTLAERIEFTDLTFIQSGLVDGHGGSFYRWSCDGQVGSGHLCRTMSLYLDASLFPDDAEIFDPINQLCHHVHQVLEQ